MTDTSHLPPGVTTTFDADEVTIIDLLPAAIAKKLSKAGINNLEDLAKTTQAKLSQIPRFGKTSMQAVLTLAEDNNVDIPKGKKVVKKTAAATTTVKSGNGNGSLCISVTVALTGDGINMQLCDSTIGVKKGASLQDSALRALEHAKKIVEGLPG